MTKVKITTTTMSTMSRKSLYYRQQDSLKSVSASLLTSGATISAIYSYYLLNATFGSRLL